MHLSVLITGASSGIGEETAVFLAHKGFRVFASARRLEKLKNLEGIAGGRITPLALDVTDAQSVHAAMNKIADEGVTLYGLVNNAGISVMGPVETVPIDDWRRQYETNIFGVVRMTQAVLPQMRAAGRGRIINVGSIAGRIAAPFQGAYASSKHALEGVSDSMRRELESFGVKVSLIRPGFINTPFGTQEQDALAIHAHEGEPYASLVAKFKAWHAKGHPSAPGPSIVAEAIYDALTAERPLASYTAPKKNIGTLALRDILPPVAADRIFRRIFGFAEKE